MRRTVIAVVTLILLARAWRRRRREQQDKAALANATSAALGMRTARGRQEQWDEAMPLTSPVLGPFIPEQNYRDSATPVPMRQSSRDNPASAAALRALAFAPHNSHTLARANTYAQSVISLPNPFDVGAVERSHTLPPASGTTPRSLDAGHETDARPPVPPKPTNWLARASGNGSHLASVAEASSSTAQPRHSESHGADLLAEMVGHQKQIEVDAHAGRETGRASLEVDVKQSGIAQVRAADAPPRYSVD